MTSTTAAYVAGMKAGKWSLANVKPIINHPNGDPLLLPWWSEFSKSDSRVFRRDLSSADALTRIDAARRLNVVSKGAAKRKARRVQRRARPSRQTDPK